MEQSNCLTLSYATWQSANTHTLENIIVVCPYKWITNVCRKFEKYEIWKSQSEQTNQTNIVNDLKEIDNSLRIKYEKI